MHATELKYRLFKLSISPAESHFWIHGVLALKINRLTSKYIWNLDPLAKPSKKDQSEPQTDAQTASSKKTSRKNYELIDPDVRLMLQVRDDNAAAFEELMRRYQNRLVAVLEHLLPGKNQAEDLAQEVFMRVYRARKSYTPGAKFSTWLFTIANNVTSNALRQLSRRKEVHLQSTPSGSVPIRPLENMAQEASGFMPTRVLDRSEQAEIVEAAIRTLNERQRMAVLLSKFEHMSYEEIADTMDLSTQAVKSLLSRARSNLKEVLMPYMKTGQAVVGELSSDKDAAG